MFNRALISLITLIISNCSIAMSYDVCDAKVDDLNICDFAQNYVEEYSKSLPIKIAPNINLVKIDSDKNRIFHKISINFSDIDIQNYEKSPKSDDEKFSNKISEVYKSALCSSHNSLRNFLVNGGEVNAEFKLQDGSLVTETTFVNCMLTEKSAKNNPSYSNHKKTDSNLKLYDSRSLSSYEPPAISDASKALMDAYTSAVRNKFGQIINIPHDKNGETITGSTTIQLIIGPDGKLMGTIPEIGNDSLTEMAIKTAKLASPFPSPSMTLLKGGAAIVIPVGYGVVKRTYTRNDREYYDR